MSYVEIAFALPQSGNDALEDLLEQCGALSVTYSDQEDDPVFEPLPGEIRLWKNTRVTALFDAELAQDARCAQVESRLGLAIGSASARTLQNRAWEREWLRDWVPLRFGQRLWVAPHGMETPADAHAIVLRLDPGLAFGTGTHATTAMCLEILEGLNLEDRDVIDFGCGSGILALSALKLGARAAHGVDVDPQARIATLENARRNELSARIRVSDATASLAPADCVLANILAQPLIALAPVLSKSCKPGGNLILSGILTSQSAEVMDAYRSCFDSAKEIRRDGWTCLHLTRA